MRSSSDAGGNGSQAASAQDNLADQLVSSALRYRGQAPLVDSLLADIGLNGKDLNGITQVLRADPPVPDTSGRPPAGEGQPPETPDPQGPWNGAAPMRWGRFHG